MTKKIFIIEKVNRKALEQNIGKPKATYSKKVKALIEEDFSSVLQKHFQLRVGQKPWPPQQKINKLTRQLSQLKTSNQRQAVGPAFKSEEQGQPQVDWADSRNSLDSHAFEELNQPSAEKIESSLRTQPIQPISKIYKGPAPSVQHL